MLACRQWTTLCGASQLLPKNYFSNSRSGVSCYSAAVEPEDFALTSIRPFSPDDLDDSLKKKTGEIADVLSRLQEGPIDSVADGEVSTIIATKDNKTAPTSYFITDRALKFLPNPATSLLATLANQIVEHCYFPNIWKNAYTVMIPKPGKHYHFPQSLPPNQSAGERSQDIRTSHFLSPSNGTR